MAKRGKEELEKALGELQVIEEKAEEKQNELTHVALGTFQASDGKWYLARIKFNPSTGNVGDMEREETGESKALAIERFKIAAVKERIVQ